MWLVSVLPASDICGVPIHPHHTGALTKTLLHIATLRLTHAELSLPATWLLSSHFNICGSIIFRTHQGGDRVSAIICILSFVIKTGREHWNGQENKASSRISDKWDHGEVFNERLVRAFVAEFRTLLVGYWLTRLGYSWKHCIAWRFVGFWAEEAWSYNVVNHFRYYF